MVGYEFVIEGFVLGQVGLLVMLYKMNICSCEWVNGLQVVLCGYVFMVVELVGVQWNEGDVFCFVVCWVVLLDSFFVVDGQIEMFLMVLDEFGVYLVVIGCELDCYLLFLVIIKVLMVVVCVGMGCEFVYWLIFEYVVVMVLVM